MKKFINTSLLLVLFFTSSAQQSSLSLSNSDDTLQYSLGVFAGQWIADNGFTINNLKGKSGVGVLPNGVKFKLKEMINLTTMNARSLSSRRGIMGCLQHIIILQQKHLN